MATRAKSAAAAIADDTTDTPAEETAPPASDAPADGSGASQEQENATDPRPLADRLAELGLEEDADGQVGLTMLTSMEGPTIGLARNDPHRCDPEEGIRLVLARFAKPA
ncbi:hypothetical protein S2M10_31720 [Sphingomonas sp. S2M10]|uniref:hypothetical protein n=1 Tax=Sphingomonas sp. S2M10 TaxID=2705010 RepID=UPI001456F405|nr:hypothetical protein [Sphingomonas sp. S2M10]NLS28163.1 hypothetical protein [Sphingomonas sp. S2M10]